MHHPRRSMDEAVGWLVMGALFGVLVRVHPITAVEFTCAAGDVACLIAAIHTANENGEADTIVLTAGTYALTGVDNTTDGLNGLPSITSPLTIVGANSGTTILELKADVGGFRLIHIAPSGHFTLEMLAHNISNVAPDCAGPVTSLGHNLIGDPTGCTIEPQDSDLTGDPQVLEFTDDGTPGHGHFPLLPTSPAIDAGDDGACPPSDQLGQSRVGPCDIGAVELYPLAMDTVAITPARFVDSQMFLFVSATSSAAPDAELFVTVPDCLAEAPMWRVGDRYVFLRAVPTCGPLNGQTVTVTSSRGGSTSAPLR